MTASDYVPTNPDLLLASEGASTDALRSPSCSDGTSDLPWVVRDCRLRGEYLMMWAFTGHAMRNGDSCYMGYSKPQIDPART